MQCKFATNLFTKSKQTPQTTTKKQQITSAQVRMLSAGRCLSDRHQNKFNLEGLRNEHVQSHLQLRAGRNTQVVAGRRRTTR